jgi:hypothetical protein
MPSTTQARALGAVGKAPVTTVGAFASIVYWSRPVQGLARTLRGVSQARFVIGAVAIVRTGISPFGIAVKAAFSGTMGVKRRICQFHYCVNEYPANKIQL